MLRKLSGLLVLLFVVGSVMAAQEKKDAKKVEYTILLGDFESYKDETLKLTVKGEEKKFKVPGDTPVGYVVGEGKTKVVKAKDFLKDVKKGTIVTVTLTPDRKKVLGVAVTDPPKPKKEDKDKE